MVYAIFLATICVECGGVKVAQTEGWMCILKPFLSKYVTFCTFCGCFLFIIE